MEKAFCFHWSNATLNDLLVRLKKKKKHLIENFKCVPK